MNYKNKHFEIIEKEYENRFNDYRDIDVEEKGKFLNENLGKLSIHQIIKQLRKDELLWVLYCFYIYFFYAVSL